MKTSYADQYEQIDYWGKLTPSEKAWLRQFNDEELGYFHPDKTPINDPTDEYKRKAWRRSSQLRRDIMNTDVRDLTLNTLNEEL